MAGIQINLVRPDAKTADAEQSTRVFDRNGWHLGLAANPEQVHVSDAFDQLILTLRESLGLTVFLITHDLDTLYAICDRVAVIADRRIVATDDLDRIGRLDHPWVQEYFNGPRGRAARQAGERTAVES